MLDHSGIGLYLHYEKRQCGAESGSYWMQCRRSLNYLWLLDGVWSVIHRLVNTNMEMKIMSEHEKRYFVRQIQNRQGYGGGRRIEGGRNIGLSILILVFLVVLMIFLPEIVEFIGYGK